MGDYNNKYSTFSFTKHAPDMTNWSNSNNIPNISGSHIQLVIDPHTIVNLYSEKDFNGNIFYRYINNTNTPVNQLVQIPPYTQFGSMAISKHQQNVNNLEHFTILKNGLLLSYMDIFFIILFIIIMFYYILECY